MLSTSCELLLFHLIPSCLIAARYLFQSFLRETPISTSLANDPGLS